MSDYPLGDEESRWIAGFEGDRRVVLSQWGPWKRLFARPRDYTRKFHHRVIDLRIEDWTLRLTPPALGQLCTFSATLDIRFQPTLPFARQHLDHLDHLGNHIRSLFHPVIRDAAEEALRDLESGAWLELGHGRLERDIEDLVQELLALRDVQSRCRCRIDATFTEVDPDQLNADIASTDPARNLVALQLMKRQRESQERLARERHHHYLMEQKLRLEQQSEVLELMRRETDMIKAQESELTLKAREQLLAEESRQRERIESDVRLMRERIRLESEVKDLELQASLEEKHQRETSFPDVHGHLQREIELLAMERQRLALEDEIQKTKQTRAQGWFSNVRNSLTGKTDESQNR
ncbi:MAG TPA: hypothetical protein DCY52_03255 [Methylococcaceae bacterium]|jgi:hypothetical protein|nr:hypothetical protein [Methylococcaceae bacterium]